MSNSLTQREIDSLSITPTKRGNDYLVSAPDNKQLINAMQSCVVLIEKSGLTIHDFELICLPKSEFHESYVDFNLKGYAAFRKRKEGHAQQKADLKNKVFEY